jgi:3-hydroxyacyl-[acyl-carrier-protein] dehydratase
VRFLLFDRVTAFEPGRRLEAVKCFSMQDEALKEHFPRRPLVPGSLVLEAMLQTTGFIVMHTSGYKVLPLFSMLEDCALPPSLPPGTLMHVTGELLSSNPKGSMGRCEARVDGAVVASIGRVLFAHFPTPDEAGLRRMFGVYADLP